MTAATFPFPPRTAKALIDPFARRITYLRVSVTDRCDFRCVYCMSEHMQFLPKRDLLTLEELDRLCSAFVAKGVRKLRITGGEPLVRRDIGRLFGSLSRHLGTGALDELTLTTNGSRLEHVAAELAGCGVKRVNVSIDSLDSERFRALTRRGDLATVLRGIDAAQAAGLRVKINAVALKGTNEDEIERLVSWAHGRDMDITFIEVMPMGDVEPDRLDQYWPVSDVRARLAETFTLTDLPDRTGGPARYVGVAETGGRIGFITPLTHNFCESCNRVRLTCTGQLFMCLGQEDAADLRAALRASPEDDLLVAAIDEAISRKPRGHDFVIERRAAARHPTPHEHDGRLTPFMLAPGSAQFSRPAPAQRARAGGLAGLIVAALISAIIMPAGAAARTIRIATEGAYPPFNYVEPGTNDPAGFEIDLGRALCAAMAAECSFVLQDWDTMVSALKQDRFDAIMSSMEITEERRKRLAFSKPYYRIPSALLTAKSNASTATSPAALAGQSIGAVADTEFLDFLETNYKASSIRAYDKLEEAQLDLLTGRIAYVLGDRLALTNFLGGRDGAACCRFVAELPVNRGLGVGVGLRKGDTDLLSAFDKAIDTVMADGTYDRIRAKYFSFDVRPR